MCDMCKWHVISYLVVNSVPSWGPFIGRRQTQFMASSPIQCVLIAGWFVYGVVADIKQIIDASVT